MSAGRQKTGGGYKKEDEGVQEGKKGTGSGLAVHRLRGLVFLPKTQPLSLLTGAIDIPRYRHHESPGSTCVWPDKAPRAFIPLQKELNQRWTTRPVASCPRHVQHMNVRYPGTRSFERPGCTIPHPARQTNGAVEYFLKKCPHPEIPVHRSRK